MGRPPRDLLSRSLPVRRLPRVGARRGGRESKSAGLSRLSFRAPRERVVKYTVFTRFMKIVPVFPGCHLDSGQDHAAILEAMRKRLVNAPHIVQLACCGVHKRLPYSIGRYGVSCFYQPVKVVTLALHGGSDQPQWTAVSASAARRASFVGYSLASGT